MERVNLQEGWRFAKANSDFLNNRENQSTTGSKQSKESVE